MARFSDVDAFLAVADSASFRQAALSLKVSKSTISRAVSRLEDYLGIALFQRDTTSVRLTDAGVAYQRGATRAAVALTQAESAAREVTGQVSGVLRITAPPALGPGLLSTILAEFLHQHPQLRVELELTDRLVNPILDGIDIAIRTGGRLHDSDLKTRPLAAIQLIAVAAPPLAEKLLSPPGPIPSVAFVQANRVFRFEQPPHPLQERLHVNDYLSLRDVALQGLGVAVMPDLLVQEELKSGRLVQVLKSWTLPLGRIWAVFPSRGKLPKKTQGMLQALIEGFQPADSQSQ